MSLIHECSGVVSQDFGTDFKAGDRVVMIPNIPAEEREGKYENYGREVKFRSSGYDGFMQEVLALPPDRVVKIGKADPKTAAITEFFSVAFHAIERLLDATQDVRDLALWGDGSLSYTMAVALRHRFPEARLTIIGRNDHKLRMFTFVDQTFKADEIPADFTCQHAIECCGGEGSSFAIDDIIRYILPEGKVVLMGVSENKVAINTRDILEKGLTFLGSSRSGRPDFENAVQAMNIPQNERRLARIINYAGEVKSVDQLHRVFVEDMANPFKTVFRWQI